jgi:soluble lytic murein transglycosylase-like protein
MNQPSAVLAIIARVAELSQPPAAVRALGDRFDTRLVQSTIESTAAAATQTPTVSAAAATGSMLRTGTESATATVTRVGAAASASGAGAGAAVSGVWVDRIPNARGKEYASAIADAAARYDLDPAFLAAVYWTESSYRPDAVSRTGAIGLGQLMPETAEWLGVDPWDPIQNIDGSARLYRYFLDRNNGDIQLAIASYAAGPGAVKRAGGIPDQFTADYITKLLARTDYLAGRRATPP